MKKVYIISPRDNWILDKMGSELARIPNFISVDHTDTKKIKEIIKEDAIFIWAPYFLMEQKSKGIDVCLFTHPKNDSFPNLIKLCDYPVHMCSKYHYEYIHLNKNSSYILPGYDPKLFKPKLVLGFPAQVNRHKGRKGQSTIEQLKKIDWIEFKTTEGKLSEAELLRFYQSLDYVCITSTLEGGPMAVIESLVLGKPVICPKSVGLGKDFEDYIIDYEAGNFKSLVDVLKKLYDKKLEISKKATQYTWKKFRDDYENLIKRISDESK